MRQDTNMSAKAVFLISVLTILLSISVIYAEEENESGTENEAEPVVTEELTEYKKGSVCGYCKYCEFCSHCDKDCPCESSPTKPNCHMCKYCKFCYLCSAVCDTVCQPGGILDKISGAIVNALPVQDKEGIDDDLKTVEGWMEANKKEEL